MKFYLYRQTLTVSYIEEMSLKCPQHIPHIICDY